MYKLIIVIIYLAQKSKYKIKMFAMHPFSFFSQSMRWYFCKDRACAMQDVANYDTVWDIIFGEILIITPNLGYEMAVTPST